MGGWGVGGGVQASDSGRKRQSKAERTGMGKTEAEMRRDISQHRQTDRAMC